MNVRGYIRRHAWSDRLVLFVYRAFDMMTSSAMAPSISTISHVEYRESSTSPFSAFMRSACSPIDVIMHRSRNAIAIEHVLFLHDDHQLLLRLLPDQSSIALRRLLVDPSMPHP